MKERGGFASCVDSCAFELCDFTVARVKSAHMHAWTEALASRAKKALELKIGHWHVLEASRQ